MIDDGSGQCELMNIVIKKRQLEARRGKPEDGECDRLLEQHRARDTAATGGQLYRIIQQFETGQVNRVEDETEDRLPAEISSPAARSYPFPFQTQPSGDSSSSVNSRLSRHSPGKHNESFSSCSDESVTSSKSRFSSSRGRTDRTLSKPNARSLSAQCSTASNASFVWTHYAPRELVFVEGKTTSDQSGASSTADDAEFFSLNGSDDNNNQSVRLGRSLQQLNIYETIPSTSNDHSSAEENIYECIDCSGASSPVPDSEKLDSSTVVSDDFGSELYDDVDTRPIGVVSAVNHQVSRRDISSLVLPAESKANKYQRKLKERVNELVYTESLYVQKLGHIVKDYMPMLRGETVPLTLKGLAPEQVFSNIRHLYRFHSKHLLPALKEAQHDLVALGKVFRQYNNEFTMYIKYSRNNKKCCRLVYENRSYFKLKQTEIGTRLDLSSYLLEPIQRLPRYLLFLDELVKTRKQYDEEWRGSVAGCRDSVISSSNSVIYENISSDDEQRSETALQSLQAAKTMIKNLLIKIDNTLSIENVKESPVDLFKEGHLLRHNEFQVTDSTKRRYLMRCFLFENSIVFTIDYKKHPKEEIFLFHDMIKMSDMGITPPEDDSATSFSVWYRKRTIKPYIMEAEIGIRRAWVNDISNLLWKQAAKDKEKVRLSKRYSRGSTEKSEGSVSSTDLVPKSPVAKEGYAMVGEAEPAHLPGDQYSSLRGVPGEIRKAKRKRHRTTWYVE